MKKPSKDIGQEQLLKEIASFLKKAHVSYMVTGSVSVIFYGRPRASHDIDFVLEAEERDIPSLIAAFSKLPHHEFILDSDLIKDAVVHKGMFNLLHLPTMLKLDFWFLNNTPFDKERFKRRKEIRVFGQIITFASPEDTILKKLLWYQQSKIEKHLIDAAFVYQIQRENLDMVYMNRWTKKQKTTKLLEELASIDLEQHY